MVHSLNIPTGYAGENQFMFQPGEFVQKNQQATILCAFFSEILDKNPRTKISSTFFWGTSNMGRFQP